MVGNLCLQSAAMLSRCWTVRWTLLSQSGGRGIAKTMEEVHIHTCYQTLRCVICEEFSEPRSGQGLT